MVQFGNEPPALSFATAPRATAEPNVLGSSSLLVYTTLYERSFGRLFATLHAAAHV